MLLKRDSGFTLIEMLLALTIMLIVTHLFLQSMLVVQPLKPIKQEVNFLEWELFLHSLKRDVRMAESSSVSEGRLVYLSEGKEYSISKYNDILRQQVDGKGHVIMLHNVESFQVEKREQSVKMVVTDLSGKQYNANLLYYHD